MKQRTVQSTIPSILILTAVHFALGGCSSKPDYDSYFNPKAQRDAVVACKKQLEPIAVEIRERKLDEYKWSDRTPVGSNSSYRSERANFYSGWLLQYRLLDTYLNWEQATEGEKRLAGYFSGCAGMADHEAGLKQHVQRVERELGHSLPWANANEERVDALESAKEIDRAQDDVLSEYRRKAVKHFTTRPGPGPRIDTFVMKNGNVIRCKTSVSDGGRAVDCR